MPLIAQTLGAFLIAAGLLSAGAVVAALLLPRRGPALFACASATAAYWIAAATFHLLAFAGQFRFPVAALLACLPIASIAFSPALRGSLARECRSLSGAAGALRRELTDSRWAIALVPLAAVVAVRALRSLVAPPLGHDALMYHLYKAGRWVRDGRLTFEAAPDAWSYFEWFPWLGSAFHAWAMLPFHGDRLAGVAGLLPWLLMVAALHAFARQLGAPRTNALFVAAAAAAMPTCLALATAGYVDHVALAFWGVAIAFLARMYRTDDFRAAIVAVGAMSLAAGTKFTYAPLLGLALLLTLVRLRRQPVVLAACIAATLPALFVFGTTWAKTGSPVYPFTLPLLGRVFPGNELLAATMNGSLTEPWHGKPGVSHWFPRLFWLSGRDGWPHVNFGIGGLLLIPTGLAGVAITLRHRRYLAPMIVPAATVALILANFLLSAYAGQRGAFVNTAGRLLAPAAVAAIVSAAMLPRRFVLPACTVSILASLWHTGFRGFSAPDWRAVGELAAFAAVAAVVCALAWLPFRRTLRATTTAAALVLVCMVAVVAWSADVAARYRQAIHAQVRDAEDGAYDFHPPGWTRCWPLWRALDQPQPLRIALTAGWTPDGTGVGHNWLRYPYLGSRLQNDVTYVPVTLSGEVVDYSDADALAAQASYDHWLDRLRAAGIEYVVPLDPYPLEYRWMNEHPGDFERLSPTDADDCAIYAVKRPR